jgi:hypothetical protein
MNEPKAAVFRVPKGRLRSETGSQTNISPSKMMLVADFVSMTTWTVETGKALTHLSAYQMPCQ